MNKKAIFGHICGVLLALTVFSTSCEQVLEEQPRASLTPDFFSTEQGINYGLTAAYSSLRFLYGPIGPLYATELGTDEATYGNLKDGGAAELDSYGTSITASNGQVGTVWGRTFPYINTCNGIIELGGEAGASDALIAEARFLRALEYFLLVQTHGGVPLDLGAGELKFNTNPVRVSTRNSVDEVYAAIFADLEFAVANLPATKAAARATSTATVPAAQHLLAKAYLTYGWYCETNGGSASDYFTKAYSTAMAAINGLSTSGFALQQYYHDVNLAENDRNNECIFICEHTTSSQQFDESAGAWGNAPEGSMKVNRSTFAMNTNFEFQYTQPDGSKGGQLVARRATQGIGRPWRRIAPTYEVITKTFADKVNDSRYDGTFVKVWYANQAGKGIGGQAVAVGDTAIYMPGSEIWNVTTPFVNDRGTAFGVWTPKCLTRDIFPTLWKYGPHYPDDPVGKNNDPSYRPIPIMKVSELYLIAAEAAVKGASGVTTSARDLLLVLRKRAAQRAENTAEQNAAAEAAMIAATPSAITIDYILDERSRELYGEYMRWFDLTRTRTLKARASSYSICESGQEMQLKTFTRDIQDFHYLRPIPQSQLDNLDMTDSEKAAYQNPGYN